MNKSNLFFNKTINKKELKRIIEWSFKNQGSRKAAYFIDQLKKLGFEYATYSGTSIGLEDLRVPPIKKILMEHAQKTIFLTQEETSNGLITEVERFQKIINIWNLTSETLKEELIKFFKHNDPLNSVYIMAFSGARGNIDQVRQLVGMRGLMSDPNGQIIDQAISTNFREGLSVTDYIISSYGARKGIVDTAIKTADSGYLTRRLVEITQSIIISELDCKTKQGILLNLKKLKKTQSLVSLHNKLFGRVLVEPIVNPIDGTIIASSSNYLTYELIEEIISIDINFVKIRSPLTCKCRRSICQKCYGLNMASGALVNLGETVGLVAAQSIGEPGTQLTMRTFHTGGVFTSELTRQARANSTGYLRFLPTYPLKDFRTRDGQNAYLNERESVLRIINYFNNIIELKIEARTIILVKNYSCIKVDDILFEAAPILKDRIISQKEIKYITTQNSGELILENNGMYQKHINFDFRKRTNNNYIFWVLSGQVFTLPLGSQIKVRKFQNSFKNQSISQSKVVTTISGFTHICKEKYSNKVLNIKIQNFFENLNKFNFFIERNISEIEKCKIYLSLQEDIVLKPLLKNNKLQIGLLNQKKYRTKTGGKFYSFNFSLNKNLGQNTIFKRKKQQGYTIFYVPTGIVKTVCKKKQFKFKDGDFIQKNSEIFPYYSTSFSGFIHYDNNKVIKTITIIPGERYFSNDKRIEVETINNRVYFNGEIFLNLYQITKLSYLEVRKVYNGFYFYFIPITRYEIVKNYKFSNKDFFPLIFNLTINENNLVFESGDTFQRDTPIQFLSYPIILAYPLNLINTETIFEVRSPCFKNLPGKIILGITQTLLFENIIPKVIKKKNILLELLVADKQFVEAYTTICSLNIIMPWTDYIFKIKAKSRVEKTQLLLTTTTDYKTLFFENFTQQFSKNTFSKVNRVFNNNLILKESGLIRDILGNSLYIHLAQPYLFSKGAILRKLPGHFVEKQESLGQLIYERLKTGDIIQGLPKVDEILEVRRPKNEALVAITQGIITNIRNDLNKIFITIKPNKEFNNYEILPINRILVKKFQYISIGQPISTGRINPHSLLQIYFRYFFSLNNLSVYEAAYRSIVKLQVLILKSIQTIYTSQGVHIADKHIELIVKEITKKVYIEYPGHTNFLPGDIIDLDQAYYVNKSLNKKNTFFYRPLLLGITKSSLKIDGFLAAASFQETTRVLTQSAIEGKTDWLQGLKESAITGRLIPAGTGFYKNQDITYQNVLLPKSRNSFQLKTFIRKRQHLVKKTIKFKYNKNGLSTY